MQSRKESLHSTDLHELNFEKNPFNKSAAGITKLKKTSYFPEKKYQGISDEYGLHVNSSRMKPKQARFTRKKKSQMFYSNFSFGYPIKRNNLSVNLRSTDNRRNFELNSSNLKILKNEYRDQLKRTNFKNQNLRMLTDNLYKKLRRRSEEKLKELQAISNLFKRHSAYLSKTLHTPCTDYYMCMREHNLKSKGIRSALDEYDIIEHRKKEGKKLSIPRAMTFAYNIRENKSILKSTIELDTQPVKEQILENKKPSADQENLNNLMYSKSDYPNASTLFANRSQKNDQSLEISRNLEKSYLYDEYRYNDSSQNNKLKNDLVSTQSRSSVRTNKRRFNRFQSSPTSRRNHTENSVIYNQKLSKLKTLTKSMKKKNSIKDLLLKSEMIDRPQSLERPRKSVKAILIKQYEKHGGLEDS